MDKIISVILLLFILFLSGEGINYMPEGSKFLNMGLHILSYFDTK
jgi:hypothetical protein